MRTGAEYREALRDGRRVWVIGEGLVEDVTVHPATRATVDEYVAWYDRHFEPEWRDILLTPADAQGARAPWAYALPRSVQDLRAMGKSFSATTFLSAGNITHTPAYGNLIALGILDAVQFFFSSRRRHTRLTCDWSSDVCSSDLYNAADRRRLPELASDLAVRRP